MARFVKCNADPADRRAAFTALSASMREDKCARWDYLLSQYAEARAVLLG
jgi:hypothetical protein